MATRYAKILSCAQGGSNGIELLCELHGPETMPAAMIERDLLLTLLEGARRAARGELDG